MQEIWDQLKFTIICPHCQNTWTPRTREAPGPKSCPRCKQYLNHRGHQTIPEGIEALEEYYFYRQCMVWDTNLREENEARREYMDYVLQEIIEFEMEKARPKPKPPVPHAQERRAVPMADNNDYTSVFEVDESDMVFTEDEMY